jgi:histidine triad (HIT) family protein
VHAENIYEIVPELAAAVMVLGARLARAIRTAFVPEGVNLINSTGGVATQTVLHFHLHVVPRWSDDAMVISWPENSWQDARLDEMAGCLSSAIADR